MTARVFINFLKSNQNLIRFRECYGVSGKIRLRHHVMTVRSENFKRLFCTETQNVSKTSDVLFEQLRNEIQNSGFINHKLIEKVIAMPKEITSEDSLLLINGCARFLPTIPIEEKMNTFRKAWTQLKSNAKPTKAHYLSALNVFRVNRFPLDEVQSMLQGSEYETNPEIYEGLIAVACENGNMIQATEILANMKSQSHPITENVFSSLIIGYSRTKDLENCVNVLQAMMALNMESSDKIYMELIRAYIENNLPEKAMEIFNERQNTLESDQLIAIMKCAAIKGCDEIVAKAIDTMPSEMTNVMEIPSKVQVVCTELVLSGHVDEAFLIVSLFPTPQFAEGQDTDNFGVSFINDCIRTDQPTTKIIEYCKQLVGMGKNNRAMHVGTEIALRRTPEKGLEYLQALAEVEELRPHYFWPLMLHRASNQGEIGILEILKEMTALKVDVDYETMSSYVFPRLSVTCKDAKNTIHALEECGLKTSEILTPFISHLLLQQRFEDIGWILETYQSKIDTDMLIKPLINVASNARVANNPNRLARIIALLQSKSSNPKSDLSGAILLDIIRNQRRVIDSNVVLSLVNEFKTAGVKISSEAAEAIKTFLEKSQNSDGNSLHGMVNKGLNLRQNDRLSIHPRDMALEDLECHLIELENKGMNTRGVLRRTLQLAVREGKYDRALELHKKCVELKVQKSPGMMASIFEMHVKLGNMTEATQTHNELKKTYPGFQIDEHKVIDYATLLVQNGQMKEAKKILKQRAASTKIQGGEYVSKNVWQLLTTVAQNSARTNPKGQTNQAKEMLEYLNSLGYCAFSNTHLGAIIREYFLKTQIFQAVTEFRRIAEEYRKTPLQLELMNELVRLSSMSGNEHYRALLQDVVSESTKIHGALNTNINLILAIAESGTSNQLRKLLIDPQIKFNEDYLIRNCEHLSSSGKINVLLKLARAARGLTHIIKEQDLYNILLNYFVRENNCASALELFEKLEADDEFKISQDFVRSLVDLLKRNNQTIPSNVALRAQMIV